MNFWFSLSSGDDAPTMRGGIIDWCELVSCGHSHHEAMFDASLWSGVRVAFNPCDLIPSSLIANYEKSRCDSVKLVRRKNLALQEMWLGLSDERMQHFPQEVASELVRMAERRQHLAEEVLNATDCVSVAKAIQSRSAKLAWAGLLLDTNGEELDSSLDSVAGWASSHFPMVRLVALSYMRRHAQTHHLQCESVHQMILALSSSTLHPHFKNELVSWLIDLGNESVLYHMICRLTGERNLDRERLKTIRRCVARVRELSCNEHATLAALTGLALRDRKAASPNSLWYSVLSLCDVDAAVLIRFAATQAPSVARAIALVLSTEQLSLQYGTEIIESLNNYPKLEPLLLPCISSLLESLEEGDVKASEHGRLLNAALSSSSHSVRVRARAIASRIRPSFE